MTTRLPRVGAVGQDDAKLLRNMPELTTSLLEIEEQVRALEKVREGTPTLSTDYVLDRLLLPLLAIAKQGPGVVTIAGALRELSRQQGTEVSPKYLTRKLSALGRRSRLEVWRDQGLAEQTDEGIWLINRAALASIPAGLDSDEHNMEDAAAAAAEELYDACA